MAAKMVSHRLDAELIAWADDYAKQRKSTRTAIIDAALREFREACEGGVPELPKKQTVPRVCSKPAVPKIEGVTTARQFMLDRQAKLNVAKDRA